MRYIVIPENAIEEAAYMMQYAHGSSDNSFTDIMGKMDVYKKAEMTPIVLMDPADYTVYVVAKETFMQKLH